jgi:hypothetical protein
MTDGCDRAERIALVRAVVGDVFVGRAEVAPPGHAQTCWCAGRRYTCPGCRRFVLECNGAADGAPELCDDCYGVLVAS